MPGRSSKVSPERLLDIIYIFCLEDVKGCRDSSANYYLLLRQARAQPIFPEARGPLKTLKRNFGAKNIVNGLLTTQQWDDK